MNSLSAKPSMLAASPVERNSIITRWTMDCVVAKGETIEDSELRRMNLMEALDDVPADILSTAFKLARRQSPFVPQIADVYAHAGPMMKDRLSEMRIERERLAASTRKALPVPVYVNPADTAAILAEFYRACDASAAKERGDANAPIPRKRVDALAPQRMPTPAESAAMATEFAARHGFGSNDHAMARKMAG